MKVLEELCSAEIWSMDLNKVQEAPRRFEAGYYASEGYRSVDALRHSGFELKSLESMARIKWFGPFARKYVANPANGCPFLTSSTMIESRPKPDKLVSIKHTGHLEALKIYNGTILISCSGTIGNVVLCTKDVDGWACSQDAIRVFATEINDLGLVYCFLQSPLGQFLLKKSQTGSVVRHIYEDDVAVLPVPILPGALRRELTQLIVEASRKRVEGNRLLDEAEGLVRRQLYLPAIEEFLKMRAIAADHSSVVFNVSARDRIPGKQGFGRCRLDATAHDPAAVALRAHLLNSPGGTLLSDLCSGIRNSNLRKRVYVDDPNFGVPLLGGKQLMQLKPNDLNYLSTALTKKLKREQVEEGWVVVTCGGTVGRTLLVHRNYDGWVMSQHVMRVIPNENKVNPGFLYAFLASPYGQLQLDQFSYGSVQKELRDFHFADVALRVPDDKGLSVHEIVIAGFDARADAKDLEDRAFDLFLSAVKMGRTMVEAEWGKEY